MPGPPAGIRFVDVSQILSGPFACMVLADQGAAVEIRNWKTKELIERMVAPSGLAPAHGEHTEAVLAELGYDAAAIAALRGEGVIP